MLFGKNNAWLTHNKAQKKTKQTLISTLKSVMRFWAIVVCWVLPLVAIGEVRFTHLLQESHQAGDGIGATTNIIQDQHGFIWIAGENGVLRYDGINTKHYIHSPSQISLSSNFTRNILEDHSGVIWVGTDFGICFLDIKIDNFRCFTKSVANEAGLTGNTIYALALGEDNALYIGTENGLNILSPDRKTFRYFFSQTPSQSPHPLNHIASLFLDQKRLWIGTLDNGYGIFNIDTKSTKLFPFIEKDPHSVTFPHVRHFLKDNLNRIWISTYGGGLNRLEPGSHDITVFRHSTEDTQSIGSDVIWKGFQDSQGTIWFATDHGGLAKFNEQEQNFTNFQHDPYDPTSLSSNQVRTIYEDQSGNLWIGTFPKGINYINRSAQSIEQWTMKPSSPLALTHSAILSFLEDSRGHIWVGTENGLNEFNPKTKSFHHYLPNKGANGALQAGPVLSLTEGPNGNIWVGTWSGGLHKLNILNNQFEHFEIDKFTPGKAKDKFIWQLLWRDEDELFIATESHGLAIYSTHTETFSHFSHNPFDGKSISSDFVVNLRRDGLGRLWVLTRSGIDLFDYPSKTFTRFKDKLITEKITEKLNRSLKFRSLTIDHKNRIWIGSQNNGIFIFDPQTFDVKQLDISNGLPANFIASMAIDHQRKAWVTTPGGVARVDVDNLKNITIFTEHDGLIGNHYNRNATMVDKKGWVYLGGIDGVSRFDPNKIHNTLQYSPVRIQDFRILNQSVKPMVNESPLKKSILDTKSVQLKHKDAMITFEYIALNFSAPNSYQYAYRLDGFDNHWNFVGNKRFATYTNLNHGHYTFRVIAKPDNGDWPSDETQIKLLVLPPPWLTWWAFTIYGVIFLLLSAFLVRLQRKRVELMSEKSLNVELRRLNRIKDAFLANTSHELRTPLNGIIGIAESVYEEAKGKLDRTLLNKLSFIALSGKRLSSLINDILDYSKLGKNKLTIYPKSVDLAEVTHNAVMLLQPLAREKNLIIINRVKPTLSMVFADENRLQQVLLNLIGNAIKYTDHGSIRIFASENDGFMEVHISDNGVGMDPKDIKYIFNAFHQIEDQVQQGKGGTGLGLAVTKELIELQGGQIWVESKKNVGSTFSFKIPLHTSKQSASVPPQTETNPLKTENKPDESLLDEFYEPSNGAKSTSIDICAPPEKAKHTTILIVDDDPVNRMVLSSMLQLHFYNVVEASNGPDALSILKEKDIDLVVLDIMMPKMSGFEVCSIIRQFHPIHDMPVLFLTAKKVDEDVAKGFSVGANEFLTKPISKYEFLPRIANHVNLLHLYRSMIDEVDPA